MPFDIVRGDIAEMTADAIVDPANPRPAVGSGADWGIHKKAGPRLLEARKKIGDLAEGECAVTPAYGLDAKYVIHVSGPVWRGGDNGEEELLRKCYRDALRLAAERGCRSIAFPLLCAGNNGFPNDIALRAAVEEPGRFLTGNTETDMLITLAVFSDDIFRLSGRLFSSVAEYIDDNYVREKLMEEYCIIPGANDLGAAVESGRERGRSRKNMLYGKVPAEKDSAPYISGMSGAAAGFSVPRAGSANDGALPLREDSGDYPKDIFLHAERADAVPAPDWDSMLSRADAGFSETLMLLIDRTGRKDSEIYKRANIDRKLFSKIRSNADYKPSKMTALAFAIALELSLDETKDLLSRAGYALSRSSKSDIIIEYFILHRNYNVFELNEVLFAFHQPCIGTKEQ